MCMSNKTENHSQSETKNEQAVSSKQEQTIEEYIPAFRFDLAILSDPVQLNPIKIPVKKLIRK